MAITKVEQKVLVIGGGIVGLLIAQGLKKEGIPCTVYEAESASQYRPREWGMSIQWGLPLLKTVFDEEKYSKISTTAVDPYYEPDDPGRMPTFNGATGEHMKDIPLLRMYRVSRRKFRAFCAEGIDIKYDKSLKDISFSDDSQTATATFEDGTAATGTLVIGADGPYSQVRNVVFDNDKEKAAAKTVPYNVINHHVCFKDADKARHVRQNHPIMYHGIHPEGYWLFIAVQDIPDPEKPETWVFQVMTTFKKSTEPNLADNEVSSVEKHWERAQIFGEPFRSANLWIPEGSKLGVNKVAYWIPEKWDTRSGRVLLAGDAAHPMTFHRGQGLNHGIADASHLTTLLKSVASGDKTQDQAVTEYMDDMVQRAGEEVRSGLMNTELFHDWEKVSNSPFFKQGGHASQNNKQALEETRHKEAQAAAEAAAKATNAE